jgi:hypothetical protein
VCILEDISRTLEIFMFFGSETPVLGIYFEEITRIHIKNIQNPYHMPGVIAHSCNHSIQEMEAGGLRVGQPELIHGKTLSQK